ncbi:antibiotic biosynthesis monooxygenase [Pseudomonadales bacterium]|jgi:quinol monooxygenase YgiN|nr:antibiotic biosynthesis monooxygenase [Pseudomonadales bacterium]MDC0894909.1 putative quinol monooxygenase [Pseudomonadales bacterium]
MFKIIFTLSLSLPHATLSCWLYTSKGLIMTVIISGYVEFENPKQVPAILVGARAHIEGALAEEGCIAYSWTEDHLTPGRVWVYEEWTSEATLDAHLNTHWYRDMGAYLSTFSRKSTTKVIKKYRVDIEEPVYDDAGVARGYFFTA